MTKRILIGKVASAHGIKGDVKVLCYADDAALLFSDAGVYIDETTPKRVVLSPKSEPKANLFIATIEGVNDRNAAERIGGTPLYIERDELPEAEDGQIYHSDLEGMDVVSAEGKAMGKVLRVQNFGAGDLLEIQGKKESYYLPFAAPYLVSVDTGTRVVTMNEPDVLGGKE
jgi:16S rRNA processing protein RimM